MKGSYLMADSKFCMSMNDDIIRESVKEACEGIKKELSEDICKIYLYGSCARGDYNDDSDIDIAIMTKCDRMSSKKYGEIMAEIATAVAMKYNAIVNFVCIPYSEYLENKSWYPYFASIERDGICLD